MPQGSILGTVSFNLHVTDILLSIYASDIVVLANGRPIHLSSLDTALTIHVSFLEKLISWSLSINLL